jgi:hypothetical protein
VIPAEEDVDALISDEDEAGAKADVKEEEVARDSEEADATPAEEDAVPTTNHHVRPWHPPTSYPALYPPSSNSTCTASMQNRATDRR